MPEAAKAKLMKKQFEALLAELSEDKPPARELLKQAKVNEAVEAYFDTAARGEKDVGSNSGSPFLRAQASFAEAISARLADFYEKARTTLGALMKWTNGPQGDKALIDELVKEMNEQVEDLVDTTWHGFGHRKPVA